MKALMLILDGAADRPLRDLDGNTPLEAATVPNLNALASLGVNGLLDPIAPGIRVGSDTTHLALLGYDPYEIYSGRGPFEALGIGLDLGKGDIALRCNFATVKEDTTVLDRRAGRISEGTQRLAEALTQIDLGQDIIFKESVDHRGVLVLRGKGRELNPRVSDSDPHRVGEKIQRVVALDDSTAAKATADLLNDFSEKARKVLKAHEVNKLRRKEGKPPANAILLRGCGKAVPTESFRDKYCMKGSCMATVAIIKGIARATDMDLLDVPVDYSTRVKRALDSLEECDFLLMNIKEPDEASHDHDHEKKMQLIKEIDSAVAPLLDFVEENYLVILSDHTTSTSYGDHTGDPVPLTIVGPEVRSDEIEKFNERSAAKGGLGRIRGRDLMPILVDLMNKSEKFGA
ncbi:MAG: 2,3-bisphosphoglycerate-independent phosphoglycerate mutase [Candidatus Hydrothermarchaeales archaeon]